MTQKATYIIGEIGQNHNGSVDIAKLIVEMVAQPIREELFDLELPRIDAVKLTKRDLNEELSASQMARPYDTPNSFGATYGEHREFLELSDEEHLEIFHYAKEHNLQFVETLCAIGCLSILNHFTPDRLKVASRDLTNLPLLDAMAQTKIPIILSTGMAGERQLAEAVEVIVKHHEQIGILHCVSQYPTEPDNVNLNTIRFLQERYGQFSIGFSDHTVGIVAPVAAVAMGAEIIEKHITIDREMKGTDQKGSLAPDGVRRMVRDIRLIERSLGKKEIFIDPSVEAARHKLERSLATKTRIKKGQTIGESDVHLLSPGDGVKWSDRNQLIGKVAKEEIPADEIIYPSMVE